VREFECGWPFGVYSSMGSGGVGHVGSRRRTLETACFSCFRYSPSGRCSSP